MTKEDDKKKQMQTFMKIAAIVGLCALVYFFIIKKKPVRSASTFASTLDTDIPMDVQPMDMTSMSLAGSE